MHVGNLEFDLVAVLLFVAAIHNVATEKVALLIVVVGDVDESLTTGVVAPQRGGRVVTGYINETVRLDALAGGRGSRLNGLSFPLTRAE